MGRRRPLPISSLLRGLLAANVGSMSLHAADNAGPRLKREPVLLRRPADADRHDAVDLDGVAAIIRSGVLTAEIDDANHHDPDLAV